MAATAGEVLLARQPICDERLATVGYELLFRDATLTVGDLDPTAATARVLVGAVADVGLASLVGGHRAWLNAGAVFLHAFDTLPLPPERIVLEVLETVEPEPSLLARLAELRATGFTLAADDFAWAPELEPLLDEVDVVKLDVRQHGLDGLAEQVARLDGRGLALVAEKVETAEEFEAARALGCTLFQGWFHARPVAVHGVRVPTRGPGNLASLAQVAAGDAALDELERVVSLDAGLSLRLLRLLNSAALAGRCQVRTVRQALALLGERQARQWLMLVLLGELAPADHVALETAIVRARACELLTPRGVPAADAFAVGLLSVAGALTGMALGDAVAELPLGAELKAALLCGAGPTGEVLGRVLEHEQAVARGVPADPQIAAVVVEAAAWARRVLTATT